MQNVALIINTLQRGGAERCAADLSVIFAQKGFSVFIFTDLSIGVEYEYAGKLIDYKCTLGNDDKTKKQNPLSQKVNELKDLKS